MIIRKYLTRRPKSGVSKEFKALVDNLASVDENEFSEALSTWHKQNKALLKSEKRLKASYESVQSNLSHLFTCEHYREIDIDKKSMLDNEVFKELKLFMK